MSEPVPLIVPTMRRFDLFVDMIKSVDYPIIPYIINNSSDNIGVAASWNRGIRGAMSNGHRYAVISNDDIRFMPDTISRLVEGIKNSADAFTISTNSILLGRDSDLFYPRTGYIDGSEYSCFIVDMIRLVHEVGFFDENFYPGYYEDNDMNYRIKLVGGREYIDTEIGIYHHGSATGEDVVSHQRWQELSQYYESKWGGPPKQEIWTSPYNDSTREVRYWRR